MVCWASASSMRFCAVSITAWIKQVLRVAQEGGLPSKIAQRSRTSRHSKIDLSPSMARTTSSTLISLAGRAEAEATAHAFGGSHQAGLGQAGEDLGQQFRRHALQLGEGAYAGLAAVAFLVGEEQQAVDAVFDAGAIESHH